ncbi:MAG: hypothetical protein R3D25_16995 [Geminicoccaceae bacterium]
MWITAAFATVGEGAAVAGPDGRPQADIDDAAGPSGAHRRGGVLHVCQSASDMHADGLVEAFDNASSRPPGARAPALFIRMSIRSWTSSVSRMVRAASSSLPASAGINVAPVLSGDLAAELGSAPGEDDLGPFRTKAFDNLAADAAGAAGYQGDLVLQSHRLHPFGFR